MKANVIDEILGNLETDKDVKTVIEVHTLKSVYLLNFIDDDSNSAYQVYEDGTLYIDDGKGRVAYIDCDQVISIEYGY